MNFPTPRIIDSTLTSAVAAGCDCVMLKHCGFPISINCGSGVGNVYTAFKFGYPNPELLETFTYIEPISALLVGSKDPFNNNIHISDLWWINGNDLQKMTYRERYFMMRLNIRNLDERFKIVLTHPIAKAHELWTQVIKDPTLYKGLVFRKSKDTAAGTLYVRRYYPEAPTGLD